MVSLSFLRIFTRLLGYGLRYKARLLFAFALALAGVAVELVRPFPIKIVVDNVLAKRPLPPAFAAWFSLLPGAESPTGLLVWCVVAAVSIALAGSLFSLFALKASIDVARHLVFDLSLELFAKFQRLTLTYHNRNQVGDLSQRMNADVFAVHLAIAQVAIPVVVSLLSLGGMFFIMARLDVTLALIAISVVPLLAVALLLFTKPMTDTTTRQYQTQGVLTAFVHQSLSAIKGIQGFARESYVEHKLGARARDFGDAFATATHVGASYNQVVALITGVAAAVLLGLGATRVLDDRLSLGDLLIFIGYLAALYGPVNSLSIAVGSSIAVVTRGRRVFEIMDSEEVVPVKTHPVKLGRARGKIVFDNVTFGYAEANLENGVSIESPRARTILDGISFRARPGQITAIVGATGAGKTSLVSLLSRFYDPWSGRVLLDDYDLRDLELDSLRENISLVLQDPFLFPMSVSDNIAFGRPEASRAEIVRVAEAAHAHDFIEQLPQGYDTIISERGTSLSGGERQRIAIARAVLKDAPVLILDEPTSALDAHTEGRIFQALSTLMEDRTTFIISHRLSTIRRADQILALEAGRVVERGTHESLLAADSVYANLYKHQHIAVM